MKFATVTMKPYLGGALAIGLLMIGAPAEATSVSCSTIWANTLSLDGSHTKVLPRGCDAISDAPFTFSSVPDPSSISHKVTIQTLEIFSGSNGINGVYISGLLDTTSFAGVISGYHVPDVLGVVIPLNSFTPFDFAGHLETIVGGTFGGILPADFLMQMDPSKTNDGNITIAGIGPVAPDLSVQVTDAFNFSFDLSLNNGINFVLEDPTLNLETFDLANSNPLIQEYFASVPEPATLGIFGVGLAGLGWMRRRRKPA